MTADEYKPVITYDESGKALVETLRDINQPADYSFATVNDFVHTAGRTYEELEVLCLGMAEHIDKIGSVRKYVDDEKKHWYSFSFSGIDENSGCQCNASTYIGYKEKLITRMRIDYAKKAAGVSDAVLLNASYLGYMTKEQFLT